MSVLTEVLKLFKYDPATDGDMTFNIGQCMNDNWDKLDAALLLAIAAAGAYNPEESYAVGDYCTYKGKLRKCSTAIPTGETWTEAHWTTTTVAAEMQELSSQLSNLIGTALPDRWIAIPVGKKLWFYTGGQMGYYLMDDGIDFAIYDHDNHELFSLNYARTPTIQGDVALATATPPQEFDLPLADGISDYATSVYHKNQFSEVSVRVSVSATNAIQNGATIATLPEGFRPAKAIDTDATGYVSGSSWFACRLVIQSSGAVQIYWGIGSSPATFIVGSFAPYLAVD